MPWIRFGVRTIYRQRARPADRQTVWTCGRCWSTWSLKSKNTILERDPSGHPQGAVRRPHRPRRPLRRLRRGGSAALLRRRRLQGALQPRGPGGHHRALPGSRLHLSAPGAVRSPHPRPNWLKLADANLWMEVGEERGLRLGWAPSGGLMPNCSGCVLFVKPSRQLNRSDQMESGSYGIKKRQSTCRVAPDTHSKRSPSKHDRRVGSTCGGTLMVPSILNILYQHVQVCGCHCVIVVADVADDHHQLLLWHVMMLRQFFILFALWSLFSSWTIKHHISPSDRCQCIATEGGLETAAAAAQRRGSAEELSYRLSFGTQSSPLVPQAPNWDLVKHWVRVKLFEARRNNGPWPKVQGDQDGHFVC